MVKINISKIALEKCGIEIKKANRKVEELMEELNATEDPAKILILCDKVTDEIKGFDTDGFKFK